MKLLWAGAREEFKVEPSCQAARPAPHVESKHRLRSAGVWRAVPRSRNRQGTALLTSVATSGSGAGEMGWGRATHAEQTRGRRRSWILFSRENSSAPWRWASWPFPLNLLRHTAACSEGHSLWPSFLVTWLASFSLDCWHRKVMKPSDPLDRVLSARVCFMDFESFTLGRFSPWTKS